jgi:hypothetical protein
MRRELRELVHAMKDPRKIIGKHDTLRSNMVF